MDGGGGGGGRAIFSLVCITYVSVRVINVCVCT